MLTELTFQDFPCLQAQLQISHLPNVGFEKICPMTGTEHTTGFALINQISNKHTKPKFK